MNRLFLFLCALCATLMLAAQTNVTRFTPGTRPQGIVYALPKTEVVVEVKAQCVREIPGPFYQYAERYLAVKNFISHESAVWKVTNVSIGTKPVVDESKMYQVLPDKKGWANNISFYSSCLIKGVNIPKASHSVDPHNISSDFRAPHQRDKERYDGEKNDKSASKKCKIAERKSDSFDFSCLKEEALVSSSIPKMAEMAAKQIYEIRENRAAIIGAELEVLPDGTALKAMLKEMDEQEAKLLELFLGKRIVVEETKSYFITPTKDEVDFVIARISTDEGLKSADDVMGNPIYISIKGSYKTIPEETKKEAKQKKGFYYNVPGEAVISVFVDNKIKETKVVPMPQFGYSIALPADFINKKVGSLLFNKNTGEIRAINSYSEK